MPLNPSSALCDIAETGGVWHFSEKTTLASWGGIPSFHSLFQRILWGKSGVCIGEFCLRVGII